jgi:membrane protease subunit (stomatin/prohibitin family)
MELAAHGTYNFKNTDNILYVDAHGPFNEITTQQYAKDVDEYTNKFHNKKWVSLIAMLHDRAGKDLLANSPKSKHCL